MKKFKIHLVFGIIFLIATVNSSDACLGVSNPWFKLSIKLVSSELPEGTITSYQNNSSYEYEKYWSLKNESNVPVYFTYFIKYLFSDITYDDLGTGINFRPGYKLVNSKVYVWSFNDSTQTGTWIESVYDQNGYLKIDPKLQKTELSWTVENALKSTDVTPLARPKNVKIPDPFEFIIPVFYQGKELNLKFVIEYSLNENYKEPIEKRIGKPCDSQI